MNVRVLVLIGMLAVPVGCIQPSQNVSPDVALEANILVACEGFTSALRAANTFEPRMTEAQKVNIDHLVSVVDPTCHGPRSEGALVIVRDALRELTAMNEELSQ